MTRSTLVEALVGTDPRQRIRLTQTSIAMAIMVACAIGMQMLVAAGVVRAAAASPWTLFTLGSFAGFLLFIRLGLNLRHSEPSMTVAQMLAALVSSVWAYAIVGPGRGVVLTTPVVVLMFGMFALKPRTLRGVAALAAAMYAVVTATMATLRPAVYAPAMEMVHLFVVTAMIAAVSTLAAQLGRLRQRLKSQKAELAEALERIQALATRDDLTGLFNRRHMQSVLDAELQRSLRSGRPFCVAMIDLDHFKRINDTLGHAAGDAVLRAFADRATATLRTYDVLARWGGEEFLLLMCDTPAAAARLGVERLQERVATLNLPGLASVGRVTFSAGLAEHRAEDDVDQTLARADQALYQAKAAGRNRVERG